MTRRIIYVILVIALEGLAAWVSQRWRFEGAVAEARQTAEGEVLFEKSKAEAEALASRIVEEREWITPGHPLFEVVREDLQDHVRPELERGVVFLDVQRSAPARLNVYSSAIRDGRGNVLHRRLFIVQEELDGTMTIRQSTLLLDLIPAPKGTQAPDVSPNARPAIEQFLVSSALEPFLREVAAEREKETQTVLRHLDISLNELIHRQNLRYAALFEQQQSGDATPLLSANLKQAEDRLEDLNGRLESRHAELKQERNCTITDIQQIGCAWVLPHPDRAKPGVAPLVQDDEIERITTPLQPQG